MNATEYVSDMVEGYAECLIWQASDENDQDESGNPAPMEKNHDTDDFDEGLWQAIEEDCRAFFDETWEDLAGMEPHQAGHDFMLTRNGHGVGFWDRGLGERGDRLTKAAKVHGEFNIYAENGTISEM